MSHWVGVWGEHPARGRGTEDRQSTPKEAELKGETGTWQVKGLWRIGAECKRVGMSRYLGAWQGRHTEGVGSPRGSSGHAVEVGLCAST